eukprot:TRINITY_DN3100_c0_g1_i2.p1 TRINITY_DN3100_c0_g1~~TRINITY_DN3100_c0_g1_i2.p1  ORF type:complete len:918 (+),score=141.92 TRINITY_DN3100_c0_g1_i2:163-2916(+)
MQARPFAPAERCSFGSSVAREAPIRSDVMVEIQAFGCFLRNRCGSLESAFRDLDVDQSGCLTAEKLARGAVTLGYKCDGGRLYRILFAKSEDGVVPKGVHLQDFVGAFSTRTVKIATAAGLRLGSMPAAERFHPQCSTRTDSLAHVTIIDESDKVDKVEGSFDGSDCNLSCRSAMLEERCSAETTSRQTSETHLPQGLGQLVNTIIREKMGTWRTELFESVSVACMAKSDVLVSERIIKLENQINEDRRSRQESEAQFTQRSNDLVRASQESDAARHIGELTSASSDALGRLARLEGQLTSEVAARQVLEERLSQHLRDYVGASIAEQADSFRELLANERSQREIEQAKQTRDLDSLYSSCERHFGDESQHFPAEFSFDWVKQAIERIDAIDEKGASYERLLQSVVAANDQVGFFSEKKVEALSSKVQDFEGAVSQLRLECAAVKSVTDGVQLRIDASVASKLEALRETVCSQQRSLLTAAAGAVAEQAAEAAEEGRRRKADREDAEARSRDVLTVRRVEDLLHHRLSVERADWHVALENVRSQCEDRISQIERVLTDRIEQKKAAQVAEVKAEMLTKVDAPAGMEMEKQGNCSPWQSQARAVSRLEARVGVLAVCGETYREEMKRIECELRKDVDSVTEDCRVLVGVVEAIRKQHSGGGAAANVLQGGKGATESKTMADVFEARCKETETRVEVVRRDVDDLRTAIVCLGVSLGKQPQSAEGCNEGAHDRIGRLAEKVRATDAKHRDLFYAVQERLEAILRTLHAHAQTELSRPQSPVETLGRAASPVLSALNPAPHSITSQSRVVGSPVGASRGASPVIRSVANVKVQASSVDSCSPLRAKSNLPVNSPQYASRPHRRPPESSLPINREERGSTSTGVASVSVQRPIGKPAVLRGFSEQTRLISSHSATRVSNGS